MNTLCLFVLTIAGLAALSSAEICTGLEVLPCQKYVKESLDLGRKGWRETQEELDKLCKAERNLLGCLYEKIQPCTDGYNPNMVVYLDGQLNIFASVCEKGHDMNTKYLEYAKCMNEHDNTVESKCGPVRHFENPANIEDDCKTFEPAYNCYLTETEKSCGKDVRDFVTSITKPSADFAKSVCSK